MKDLNWKDCFEPAPEAFEASVRHALQTKEDKQMKRIIPRSFAIAFALILVLMATALAFGGDILNFLHTDNIGEVQIQKPEVEVKYKKDGILKEIRVDEAVCDGRSVHMLVTWIADPEKGALLWGSDWMDDPEDLPFAAERAAAPVVCLVNPGAPVIETGGKHYDVWDSWSIRYDSAYSITADITFFVYNFELGDTLTVPQMVTLSEYIPNTEGELIDLESIPYTVTMPVQITAARTYEATNLPVHLENYKILSARITRTDLGCYFEVEAEDDYDPEEYEASFSDEDECTMNVPLHNSWFFHVLKEDGTELSSMTFEQTTLERSNDATEWEHLLTVELLPSFEIGSSVTLQPLAGWVSERLTPVTLEFVER